MCSYSVSNVNSFNFQIDRYSRKRKAPTPRAAPVSKKTLFEVSQASLELQQSPQLAKPSDTATLAIIQDPPHSTVSYLKYHL